VPKKRLELSRTFVHNDLNVACLPFHHLGNKLFRRTL
jgi:hypothetical protein